MDCNNFFLAFEDNFRIVEKFKRNNFRTAFVSFWHFCIADPHFELMRSSLGNWDFVTLPTLCKERNFTAWLSHGNIFFWKKSAKSLLPILKQDHSWFKPSARIEKNVMSSKSMFLVSVFLRTLPFNCKIRVWSMYLVSTAFLNILKIKIIYSHPTCWYDLNKRRWEHVFGFGLFDNSISAFQKVDK